MAGISKAERARRAAAAAGTSVPEVTAPAITGVEAKKHSGTVMVGCKIPTGLVLQLQHKMKRPVPTGKAGVADEYQMVEVNVFGGDRYHVMGPSVPAMGGVPDGYIMPRLEAGVALTEIPRAFWETWLEQNAKADYVTSGMIFAFGDEANVKAKAREEEKKTSGLEPISRHLDDKGRMTDRRIPKPLTSSVARIGFDAERDEARRAG
jgi:hypothetical protein